MELVVRWLTVTLACGLSSCADHRKTRKFSSDFRFGVATSAYQTEGAWNEDDAEQDACASELCEPQGGFNPKRSKTSLVSPTKHSSRSSNSKNLRTICRPRALQRKWFAYGKGLSTLDHNFHTHPEFSVDRSNGDTAANSYHLYKRDVEMLKQLNVNSYRFSISWPRILPNGRPDYVNPLGIEHYNKLINLLLANGIEPFVTIYHWDLPQNLEEQGGILSENFPEWIGDYARVLYRNFGDRVKFWITVNEPKVHCFYGFGVDTFERKASGVAFYHCGRNLLLAHAKAYHIYDDEFKPSQGGKVAIAPISQWAIPRSESQDDLEAVADYLAFTNGHFMNPIFSTQGNYPQRIIERIKAASENQGLNISMLKPFTKEESDFIRGTSDFLALNHYKTKILYRNSSLVGIFPGLSVIDDMHIATYEDPSWPKAAITGISEYASGLYHLLVYIKNNYNNPMIYITENGFSTRGGLNDDDRVRYLRNYLTAVHDAMSEGVNVKGYFVWSLMDNFEWMYGYTAKFGLYEMNMSDPDRTRTARKSALVYSEIAQTGIIDFEYNPDPDRHTTHTPTILSIVVAAIITIITIMLIYKLLRTRNSKQFYAVNSKQY